MKINNRTIGIIFLTIFAVSSISGCLNQPEDIEVYGEDENQQSIKNVLVGYGWSTKENVEEAISEVASMINESLGEKQPEYVILFSTVDYNSTQLIEEVRRHYPEAQIYGGTSCTGVMTKDGYHTSEHGAVAMLAVYSDNITFGVGGAEIDEDNPTETGRNAIIEAMTIAGMDAEPDIILLTAAPTGYEEEIIEGIEEVVGENVPIFGGSSADNAIEGKWKQFANDRVYSNGVSVTVIYTDLKVGHAFESGYIVLGDRGAITKASGRRIYEINHRPAVEVYNEWTSGKVIGNYINQTEGEVNILSKATFYPLAKEIIGYNNIRFLISMHPLSVNLSDGSMTLFVDVKEGEEVYPMYGTWEILLNRGQSTPLKAMESVGMGKGEGAFGIYTFCAGTLLAIPENERDKLPALVYQTTGIPFIGTFTFGEQGYVEGIGNLHGNLVNSMVIIDQG